MMIQRFKLVLLISLFPLVACEKEDQSWYHQGLELQTIEYDAQGCSSLIKHYAETLTTSLQDQKTWTGFKPENRALFLVDKEAGDTYAFGLSVEEALASGLDALPCQDTEGVTRIVSWAPQFDLPFLLCSPSRARFCEKNWGTLSFTKSKVLAAVNLPKSASFEINRLDARSKMRTLLHESFHAYQNEWVTSIDKLGSLQNRFTFTCSEETLAAIRSELELWLENLSRMRIASQEELITLGSKVLELRSQQRNCQSTLRELEAVEGTAEYFSTFSMYSGKAADIDKIESNLGSRLLSTYLASLETSFRDTPYATGAMATYWLARMGRIENWQTEIENGATPTELMKRSLEMETQAH